MKQLPQTKGIGGSMWRLWCFRILLLATTIAGFSADADKPAMLLKPCSSPLVNFRILFMTGAADDAAGKKGIAALTAALLAQGGSEKTPYDEIVKQMYPM